MKAKEYTAIKVKCFDHWLWFKTDNITETDFLFTGLGGWGVDGALTEIEIPPSLIEARMTSTNPQFR